MKFKKLKWGHLAWACTTLLAVVLLALIIKIDSKPRVLGEFSTKDTDTMVISAGGCTVFATKFKSVDDPSHGRENFYFSCPK